jgi:hypothetical protein
MPPGVRVEPTNFAGCPGADSVVEQPRPEPVTRARRILAGTVLAAALAGCSGGAATTLRLPPGATGSAGGWAPNVAPNQPYFWNIGDACVEGGRAVRITGAQLIHPTGGLRLTDVAVRAPKYGWGAGPGPISK